MYSFIVDELPRAVKMALGDRVDTAYAGITGHSMGGHGALIIAMRNTDKYKSVSAFAPIVNPVAVPWGQTCFTGYLGEDESKWTEYDATEILRAKGVPVFDSLLIDQGADDEFLERELRPQVFKEACERAGQKVSGAALFHLYFHEGHPILTVLSFFSSSFYPPFFPHDFVLYPLKMAADSSHAGSYSHAYYFVSTFMPDHIKYHADILYNRK